MNFTQALTVLNEHKVEHHLAPRVQMCPNGDKIMFSDYKGEILQANGTMCLKFIDTDQERKIDAGISWPYEKLEPYECLISDQFYQ